jgi:predicted Rossmann-fold nucleotide-binding protein
MVENRRLEIVVSGGQTGVDRAALDVALEVGIKISGYCPRGRKAEDGKIPAKYPLTETDSEDYETRTEKNVEISDGTLILNVGQLTGGTAVTVGFARKHNKPVFILQLDRDRPDASEECRHWLEQNNIRMLNVAGPRASKAAGIYERAAKTLRAVFEALGAES